MPPKTRTETQKRKAANSTTASAKLESKRTRINKQGNFRVGDLRAELPYSDEECLEWFKEYSDTDGSRDCIGPEGMVRLCTDMDVDPEDIVMLALAWKLNASQMGYFTQAEWLKGMYDLQCDNTEKLKRKLPSLRQALTSDTAFKAIYQYSFDFAKEAGQRNIAMDMGKALLSLLLSNRWAILSTFINFLDASKYKVLNRDQWNNILEFSRTIQPDLSNYDINGAWPVMLDEFVEGEKAVLESLADE